MIKPIATKKRKSKTFSFAIFNELPGPPQTPKMERFVT